MDRTDYDIDLGINGKYVVHGSVIASAGNDVFDDFCQ